MRRVLIVVGWVGAVVLLVAGAALVKLVGPGDIVRTSTAAIDPAGSIGIRSGSGLLALTGARVLIEARSEPGVLIAAAHPVDVRDWLGGRTTRPVTKVAPTSLTVGSPSTMAGPIRQSTSATPTLPIAEAKSLGFWTAVDSGKGWRHIELSLDGSPQTYVVLPEGTSGQVQLRHGLILPGLRAVAWVMIGVGVLWVAARLFLRRRGRGGHTSAETALTENTTETTQTQAAEPPTQGGSTVGQVLAVAVVGGLILSGCTPVPRPSASWDDGTVRKSGMVDAEVLPAMKSYDTRNNKAIEQSRATGDPAVWATADSGMLYDWDTLSTRMERAAESPTPITYGLHTASVAYAPTFQTYPMWALVPVTESFGGGKPRLSMTLVSKDTVTDPWRQSADAAIDGTPLAAPARGAAAQPTSADLSRAVAAANGIRLTLSGGPEKGVVALTGDLSTINADRQTFVGSAAQVTSSATFYRGTEEDQVRGDASVRAVRTANGGLLVMALYTHSSSLTAESGHSFSFNNLAYAKALAAEGPLTTFTLRAACAAALVLPPDPKAPAVMIGSSCRDII